MAQLGFQILFRLKAKAGTEYTMDNVESKVINFSKGMTPKKSSCTTVPSSSGMKFQVQPCMPRQFTQFTQFTPFGRIQFPQGQVSNVGALG